ncbi:MAG: hypothetical protein IPJ83_06720 [Saprospiraceae bacterium]|nr:hypothetical protein [Candidatus Vicinibacter proximus]
MDKASVFLFGAGKTEMAQMHQWKLKFGERLILVQEHFTLEEQLELFNHLDVMVCMDSVNFHLANLSDIKSIISVWGPTHPFLGFGPLDEARNKVLQISTTELTCRPCSVFWKYSLPQKGPRLYAKYINEFNISRNFKDCFLMKLHVFFIKDFN